MKEAPYIIRMNIKHYEELLNFDSSPYLSPERRQAIQRLLVEAKEDLRQADAEAFGKAPD